MNQPTLTAPVRPAGVADAPDIFFVLRRYVWLIVGGVLLGILISGALFLYRRSKYPNYTASVTFQVMPPPAPPGSSAEQQEAGFTNLDEVTRFIRRQTYFISNNDNMMQQVLLQDAFQRDPVTGDRSRWLSESMDNPKKALRRDLTSAAVPSSDLFTISMTTRDRTECARLVNAVAKVYLDAIRADNKVSQSQQIKDLNDVLENQEKAVKTLRESLSDFRKNQNISAITNRHTVELELLGQLNTELLKVTSAEKSVGASLDSIKKQVENGSLQLSSDMEAYVENDPELRNLQLTKLQLDQDKEVAMKQSASENRSMQALDTRIETVDRQIQDTLETLRKNARLRMQENAQNEHDNLISQEQYFQKARDDQERKVKDLDYFLVQYQEMVDQLRVQQEIYDRLSQQNTLKQLASSTDDMRVRQYGGDAIPPDDISSPLWYYFIPFGVIGGLLVSFGAAYVYELTDTRIRTPRDVIKTMQLPLLGFVPDKGDDSALTGELSTAVRTAPMSMTAESFRQIRGRLAAETNGRAIHSLLVASIGPGGGSTTIANNLATAMALSEKRVLLVDANFYRPGLDSLYKNLSRVGLSDVIVDRSKFSDAITGTPVLPNLHVMGAGSRSREMAAEILESKAFRELIEELKSKYDLVIFDGAPLSLVSDSIVLGSRVDGVVAVVRAGEVSRGTVARIRDQLRHARANLLGVVLNAAQTHGAGYFKQNYRSFYQYAGGRGADGAVAKK